MSSSKASSTRLVRFCESHSSILHEVPDGCWTRNTLDGELADLFRKMMYRNVVEKVGTVQVHPNKGKSVWRLSSEARDALGDKPQNRRMPCGHSGFVNEKESEFYRCTRCNARYLREDL
jgi:hypothetical protein